MAIDREIRERLLALAGAVCDGAADAAEVAELEQLLWPSPENRREYLRYVFTHVDLTCSDAVLRAIASPQARRFASAPAPHARLTVMRWAVAAVLVFGAVAGLATLVNLGTPKGRASAQRLAPVAVLTDVSEAVWEGDALGAGQPLNPGFIRLRSGAAQIEFYGGATVRLQGPCEFGLNNPSRGFLRTGRLTARVPQRAHGFTIAAPGLAVVDLGTEFGMNVEPGGAAQVHVIQGQVELHVGDETAPAHRLAELQAVAVEGGVARPIAFQRAQFADVQTRTAPLLVNGGFETFVPWGRADYAYAPSGPGVGWVFEGREGDAGSGVMASGSGPWGKTHSAQGRQHAFLIRASQFSQELRSLIPGERYTLSWSDAMRANLGAGPNELRVELIDSGGTVQTLFQAMIKDPAWSRHQVQFTAPQGACTLRFRTTNPLGGNHRAVFIDDVQLNPIAPPQNVNE